MYFYSRTNFINDFFSIVYCYIVYFLLVLARKSKLTIFAFTSHKVFNVYAPLNICDYSVPRLMSHKSCQNNDVILDFSKCLSHQGKLHDFLLFKYNINCC